MTTTAAASTAPGVSPRRAVLYGTLAVGTLDILDALVFFGLRGLSPGRVFQGIASGLLGRAALDGGMATVLLGAFLHYFIAAAIVSVYVLASRLWSLLRRQPLICGPLYGLAAYFFMQRVVLQLSAIGPRPLPSGVVFWNGILAHMLLVGLPSALAARAVQET